MKTLTKFELYKLFKQKSVIFGILISFIVAIYFLNQQVLPQDISELYEPWEGKITQEDISDVKQADEKVNKDEEQSWLDFKQQAVYREILLLKEYEQTKGEIINSSKEKMDGLKSNSYEYRKLELQNNLLEDVSYQEFN